MATDCGSCRSDQRVILHGDTVLFLQNEKEQGALRGPGVIAFALLRDVKAWMATITAFLLTVVLVARVSAQQPTVNVPGNLKPAANESLMLVLFAKGVQIYECRAKADQAAAYEWAFVAPEADLFDVGGTKAGRHYAGPHWESTDGSNIVGTVKERADAPEANAIPWLLLTVKSVGSNGALSKVTSVQRVNTTGGAAPKSGCSQATAGTRARIDYTADYYFFAAR